MEDEAADLDSFGCSGTRDGSTRRRLDEEMDEDAAADCSASSSASEPLFAPVASSLSLAPFAGAE